MPYATPEQYFSAFGLTEAVQMLADEEQLLTATLLKDALAVLADTGTWSGSPSAEEQAAGLAAAQRLLAKLASSSNFMDGYLRSAVTLPLAPENAAAGSLQDCCTALTRCALADDTDNATDRMDACCKTWRQWLADIASKKVTLVADDGSTPTTSGGIRSGQATSAYCWDSFGGVR